LDDSSASAGWRRVIDAIEFIETTLINPETRGLFVLTAAERVFLKHAFTLAPTGRLKYPELVLQRAKASSDYATAVSLLLVAVNLTGPAG
jgi:hypothetical protein